MTKKLIAMNKLLILTLTPLFACAGGKVTETPTNTSAPTEQKSETPVADKDKTEQDENKKYQECLHPFGTDPEDSLNTRRAFAIYQEEFAHKRYEQAYPLWVKIMEKAPCARLGPYVEAETMFSALLADTSKKDRREILLDTFFASFPNRIKYYGNEGLSKGRWAYYLNLYRPKEYKQVIELSERAIELEKNKLEYIVPPAYMNAVLIGLKNNKISKEEVFNSYEKIADIMEFNANEGGQYADYWKQIQDGIEESVKLYIKGEDIDQIFIPRLKANPDDYALKEKIIRFYRASKSYSNPNYIMVLKSAFEQKPDAKTAEELARYYDNTNDNKSANTYYERAAELSDDSKRKEFFYLKIASNHISAKNPTAAQTYANKVLSVNSNNGSALIILAMARFNIAQTACNDPFDRKAASWVAIDILQRAIAADPSVREDAQNRLNSYKNHAPTKTEGFFRAIEENSSYSVDCLGTSTTVRYYNE